MENYKSLYFNEESPKYVQIADYIANAVFSKYEYNYETYYELINDKIVHKELFPRSKFGREITTMKEIAATKI